MSQLRRLEDLLKQIEEQKRKYWAKMQSQEAFFTVLDRMYEISPYIWEYCSFLSILSTFFGIQYALNFRFGLRDFPLIGIEFNIALPTLEEFIRGIPIKVTRKKIDEFFREFYEYFYGITLPPEFTLNYENTLKEFIEEEFHEGFEYKFGECARYGYSRYGYSIYCRLFSEPLHHQGVTMLTVKHGLSPRPDVLIPALVSVLKFPDWIMEDELTRFIFLSDVVKQTTICGASICGVSRCPKPVETPYGRYYEVKTRWPDGREVTIYLSNTGNVLFGHLCGISRCGLSRKVPVKRDIFKVTPFHFTEFKVNAQMYRFHSSLTPTLFTEAGRATKGIADSRITMEYGEMQTLRYQIDIIVRRFLAPYKLDPFTQQKYVNFAIDYVFSRIRKHAPLEEWLDRIPEKDYENFMIEKWVKYGLERNILKNLIKYLSRWVPAWRAQVKRLRWRRKQVLGL